jgi:GAF domain-containing protein
MKSIPLKRLLNELLEFDHLEGTELQQNLVSWLDKNISYYNWTGFYFMNEEKQQLEIGPYVGAFTDHSIIPYGKGICGQVALSGKTFEVPDVNAQDNYLACSLATKSEIVVPIYANDKLIGQIDIDSHQLDPFTTEDHELLVPQRDLILKPSKRG